LQWILLCLPSHRPSSRSMTPLRCCGVLQCVAVCCSVLQCVAVCCSVLQCVAVCCSVSTFPPALFELHDSSEVGTAQRDFNTQTLLQRWIAEDELTCHRRCNIIQLHIPLCVCVYIFVHINIYLYVRINIYMYTYIHI